MKRTATILIIAAVGAAVLMGMVSGQTKNDALRKAGLSAETRAAILSVGDDVRKLEKSHQNYVRSAEELSGLYAKLSAKAREVARLAEGALASGGQGKLFEAVREMRELQQRFDKRFSTLQKEMQEDDKYYQTLSGVMKTKHDTAKAAINNIR